MIVALVDSHKAGAGMPATAASWLQSFTTFVVATLITWLTAVREMPREPA